MVLELKTPLRTYKLQIQKWSTETLSSPLSSPASLTTEEETEAQSVEQGHTVRLQQLRDE